MARALYKQAKSYYQGAYRVRIKEVRDWTRGKCRFLLLIVCTDSPPL